MRRGFPVPGFPSAAAAFGRMQGGVEGVSGPGKKALHISSCHRR